MKLEITLKSGSKLALDLEDWKVRHKASVLAGFEWTTPARSKRKLVFLSLDEVAAIVEVG